MNGERSKFKDKTFTSLNRNKRKIGNSPVPINKLTENKRDFIGSSPERNGSPSKRSVLDTLDRSRKIRQHLLDEVDSKDSKVYSFDSEDIANGKKRGNESGVSKGSLEKPAVVMSLTSLEYNGSTIESDESGRVELHICDGFMLFRKRETIIDQIGLLYLKDMREFKFGIKKILITLRNRAGYLYISFQQDEAQIMNYIKSAHSELYEDMRYLNSELSKLKELVIEAMDVKQNGMDNKSATSSDSASRLHDGRISPSAVYGPRVTRSKSKNVRDSDDELSVREKPASFSPPLKYKFRNQKVFSITQSDFKTLYNNDWINDSIIDFFIQYEIEQAVYGKALFKENDIYAFNSFFFTKLMEKKATQDVADYYENIKRWLNRVDLMSHPYIIIPINENAHWYCCIIKGLPQLLEQAKKGKQEALDNTENGMEEEDSDKENVSQGLPSQKFEVSMVESQDSVHSIEDTGSFDFSMNAEPRKIVDPPKSAKADLFIFDSLSQKHSHIHFPLKKIIIDYCQDKFDLEIKKESIRVQNAKVPKQNNFNDCGIHVIYNVKKWLNDNSGCEKLWKSFGSKHATRSFFIAKERNNMRKELIDLLLQLHKENPDLSHNRTKETEVHSDDDIQVIEYTPKRKDNSSTEETSLESSRIQSSHSPEKNTSTLDPNAATLTKTSSSIKNDTLRRTIEGVPISDSVIDVLNKIFPKRNVQIGSRLLLKIVDIIKSLKGDDSDDKEQLEMTLDHLVLGSDAFRPRDTSFRIEHDKGVTETTDVNGSDSFNEDLSNLNLTDIAETNASARPGGHIYSSSRISILDSLKSSKSSGSNQDAVEITQTDPSGSTKRRRID